MNTAEHIPGFDYVINWWEDDTPNPHEREDGEPAGRIEGNNFEGALAHFNALTASVSRVDGYISTKDGPYCVVTVYRGAVPGRDQAVFDEFCRRARFIADKTIDQLKAEVDKNPALFGPTLGGQPIQAS